MPQKWDSGNGNLARKKEMATYFQLLNYGPGGEILQWVVIGMFVALAAYRVIIKVKKSRRASKGRLSRQPGIDRDGPE